MHHPLLSDRKARLKVSPMPMHAGSVNYRRKTPFACSTWMEVPRTSLPIRGILSGGQAGEPGRLSHTTTFRERALARNVVAPLVGARIIHRPCLITSTQPLCLTVFILFAILLLEK